MKYLLMYKFTFIVTDKLSFKLFAIQKKKNKHISANFKTNTFKIDNFENIPDIVGIIALD